MKKRNGLKVIVILFAILVPACRPTFCLSQITGDQQYRDLVRVSESWLKPYTEITWNRPNEFHYQLFDGEMPIGFGLIFHLEQPTPLTIKRRRVNYHNFSRIARPSK